MYGANIIIVIIILISSGFIGYHTGNTTKTTFAMELEALGQTTAYVPDIEPIKAPSDTLLISVKAIDGTEVNLDTKEKPIFYFTFNCRYCMHVLEYISGMPNETRPYMVSGIVRDWDKEVLKTKKKLIETNLPENEVFFQNAIFFKDKGINSVPLLILSHGDQISSISGDKEIIKYLYSTLAEQKFESTL